MHARQLHREPSWKSPRGAVGALVRAEHSPAPPFNLLWGRNPFSCTPAATGPLKNSGGLLASGMYHGPATILVRAIQTIHALGMKIPPVRLTPKRRTTTDTPKRLNRDDEHSNARGVRQTKRMRKTQRRPQSQERTRTPTSRTNSSTNNPDQGTPANDARHKK